MPPTPENPTADADGTDAPRKRRRRVVRDVVTPDAGGAEVAAPVTVPAAAEPAVAPVVEPAAEAAAAPAETPAARTKARRSRRVTRTVVLGDTPAEAPQTDVAPQQDAAAEPVDEPGTDEPEAEDAVVDPEDEEAAEVAEPEAAPEPEEAPAPRRRRASRSRGRAAASGDEPAGQESAADVAPAEAPATSAKPQDAEEQDAAKAEKPARKRSTRKKAEPAEKPAADAPLDVLAALGPVRTTEEPPARARLATTALLFQAPEPAARTRRRRAQAASGAPEEIAAARAEDEGTPAVEPEAPAEGTTAADETTAEAGTGRSRRRRGGRGRKASAEPTTEGTDDELATTEADGATDVADDQDALEGGGGDAEQSDTEQSDTEQSDTERSDDESTPRRRRRRGGRGRRGRSEAGDTEGESAETGEDTGEDESADEADAGEEPTDEESSGSSRRRRRRRRGSRGESSSDDTRRRSSSGDEVTALRGSTRLEAKRQRRREGRDAGRRRQIITEAEFLARRESVERTMVVREQGGRTQIAVLEDGVLVEHYVSNQAQASMVGNVYLGRVQNVLPSMEAAFVDVGKGRNAVLYAGEVNWDAVGLEGQPRRIEQALKSGDSVLVQVTKDPIGHKGARLTSQITLAGRYLVYVPGGGMTGISRKLPDTERSRLKKILRDVVPDSAGVIVRTAAEGASEDELRADVARLQAQWDAIEKKRKSANAPALLQGEPDMAIRVVRDIFNDDFTSLVVQGDEAWSTISTYVGDLAPDLAARVEKWTGTQDVFTVHRVDEQLAKGMDRKVWLPSGGSLVIDRTEAMTVVDVNTGKFTGAGGTLEETVTRNNLEAAEEIVRQLRLRDIGGIIVIDFIDMVLESNRDLVLRRLVECLGRDRTKHQVAEVTSLGLVQMTRKRVGQGLVEAFSETCEHCHGRGFIVHTDPVSKGGARNDAQTSGGQEQGESKRARRKRAAAEAQAAAHPAVPVLPEAREAVKATLATIAAAAAHAHDHDEHAAEQAGEQAAPGETDAHEASPVVEEPTAAEAPVAADAVEETAPAARLDVLAELSAAGVGRAVVETDAPLELHAVGPEVFEADDDAPDGDSPDEDAPPQE